MKPHLNSTDLLVSIKRRASIPASQNTFTDEDLLNFANEEMFIGVVPLVKKMNEEYLVVSDEILIQDNISAYEIPSRAIGMTVREVAIKDTTGYLSEMTRISPENIYDNLSEGSGHQKFYFKGNKIILFPNVTSANGESLVVSYLRRPNSLVKRNRVGFITAFTSTTITLSSVPSHFATSLKYDIVQEDSPHEILTIDVTPLSINTSTRIITFAAGILPDNLKIGDTILEAHETYVPNIPSELHSMLAQRAAARVLEALGSLNELNGANVKLQEMETKTLEMMENRAEGSPLKVINKSGFLRRNFRRF